MALPASHVGTDLTDSAPLGAVSFLTTHKVLALPAMENLWAVHMRILILKILL